MKKITCSVIALIACCVVVDGFAAAKTTKQSAIQSGTTVRTKVAATGIYDQECYDMYYGCMDQFCITDNTDGGSCACSNDFTKYEKQLSDIKDTLERAEKISTEEVERIEAGANADIIFSGKRSYDEKGNIDESEADKKAKKRESLLAMFNTPMEDEDDFDSDYEDLSSKVGADLFNGAHSLCMGQMGDSCAKDIPFLKQIYSRQIVADCKALSNSVSKKESEAKQTLLAAESAVRSALRDSLESANKYDRGECMVEYKKCMQKEDACGKNWENCVFTIATENMQNNKAESVAGTKVSTIKTYDITASTMEILESKRYICERVLDSCVAVRDTVWDDFLRESAPTIRLAESQAESKKRQSCLSDISKCIQTACKDDIAGKGVATMDACLARPDMARSFCKVEIDPCERMEPQIWDYVTDKLAAMRVDACTTEVKDCFTDDTRCGSDFSKCIGMDYEYIHDICPIDKLVVCKQANPEFSMDDLDSMLMGLYLNIDNSMLDNCQNLIDQKMTELCGSTTDCNRFASDDTMGTGSIQYYKEGNIHTVSGMISFGKIVVGTDRENAGMIDIKDYVNFLSETQAVPVAYATVADAILYELENIQGTINRVIEMIEADPEIQFCINGRDLSMITGKKGEKTEARYPNLLNSVKQQIAVSALRKAQDNYNKKYNEYIAKATAAMDLDMANLMCNKLPASNGSAQGISFEELDTSTMLKPGAIVIQFGGVSNASLAAGGTHSSTQLGKASMSTASGAAAGASDGGATSTIAGTVAGLSAAAGKFAGLGGSFAGAAVSFNPAGLIADTALKAVVALASDKYSVDFDGGTREMWSIFSRETRICHYCTATVTKNCSSTHKKGFLGIGAKDELSCTSSDPVEKCEDIQM